MSSIVTIGQTGFLGSYLKDRFDTEGWPGRFEWSTKWWEWAGKNYWGTCDTVFYCARSCRKETPRRDKDTVLLDTTGLIKTLKTFPNAHIIYCSTKVVDGWTDDWERTISREEIGNYIERILKGEFHNETLRLPEISDAQLLKFPPKKKLSKEHTLYAQTKSIGETLVKSCAKDYTILRIWDITQ